MNSFHQPNPCQWLKTFEMVDQRIEEHKP